MTSSEANAAPEAPSNKFETTNINGCILGMSEEAEDVAGA
jgi:hypothetical protein